MMKGLGISRWVTRVLVNDLGLEPLMGMYVRTAIFFIGLILVCLIVWWVTRKVLSIIIPRLTAKTKTVWDDIILNPKVINSISHLIPAFILYVYSPVVFENLPSGNAFVVKIANILIIIVVAEIFGSFFDSMREILLADRRFIDKPIGSYTQLGKIIVYFIAFILMVSALINKDPILLLTSLGALAAILILVFKDTILGLVASIQLSANDMVRVGDWVTVPKFNADGDVISINLTSIRIQNFDKTFTTIPTYAFISDSFTNWRGMEISAGRRIKRAILIKIDSIKFCEKPLLDKLSKVQLLGNIINDLSKEIEEYNSNNEVDKSLLINGRNLTNIGLFRVYIQEYLKNSANINPFMTQMVRQLPPTEHGLPLEVYAFCKDKQWVNYENVMADIFDHLFASASEFELEIFENPASSDLKHLALKG